jgi:AraC-like DNA-binding protein
MKPVLEKIIYQAGLSVRLEKLSGAYCEAPWHFHPEYELVLITKGFGSRHIGDSIEPFAENDLVFIGHNLPHVWISDKSFYTNKKKNNSEYYVMQFDDSHLPAPIMALPEFHLLREFLDQSRYGISIKGKINEKAKELMIKMLQTQGLERYILFLRLMDILSKSDKNIKLASLGYVQNFAIPTNDRLKKVYQYVMDNCTGKITIQKASDIASMNLTAFCRFFKEKTKRTFTQFVNEIRIGYASKILSEKMISVSQAAYESGFNNLSYFNRQFKKIVKMTPQDYLKKQLSRENNKELITQ